jgi:hypothetical protein
MLEGLTVE